MLAKERFWFWMRPFDRSRVRTYRCVSSGFVDGFCSVEEFRVGSMYYWERKGGKTTAFVSNDAMDNAEDRMDADG